MSAKAEFAAGLVSVVTPVYNGERYLARLLDSVLAQTWGQVEMILVDDGSQDATLEIAEAYRERFRARGFDYRVVTSPHQNASAAINLGLPWVRGEFLIWPDSDDALEPESVRVRAEFLQSHPQYQCVRSLMRCWDEAGRSLPVWENLGDLKEERLFFPVLEGQTFVCCGCYMLRTRALFDLYPRRRIPEYEVGQNFQMLLPVLYRWPCPTIPEALYHVCVRADSHSRRLRNREEEIARCAGFERLIDELAEVIGIRDREELRRIQLWKAVQRYKLARRYKQNLRALGALLAIARFGGIRSGWFRERLERRFNR